ncbi:hypothetical protein CDAR_417371 [Caerostris darwini]|uniref:Uncharacterized protein n=1 Tax=Caerostris darwini TaxID=1538125 RepID=A0AAV4X5B6_9ARAC|nr:hypothetical protein CDAR_417371 [Caerostris darwini]
MSTSITRIPRAPRLTRQTDADTNKHVTEINKFFSCQLKKLSRHNRIAHGQLIGSNISPIHQIGYLILMELLASDARSTGRGTSRVTASSHAPASKQKEASIGGRDNCYKTLPRKLH